MAAMTIATPHLGRGEHPAGTMRAAVVVAPDAPLEIRDVPIPHPGPGEALVRVLTSGVCHTDLHAARGDWPVAPKSELIPGHEGCGIIVELGEGVDSLRVGDRVGNAWLWSACGACEFCRTGRETLCPEQRNGGYSVDGSFGEYMLVDERFAARIPEGVDTAEVAPILCAGVTVYKGLKMADTKPGQWMVVSGVGGLGHIAVQYARAMGMRVAAVDVDEAKLALARHHGAELTVDARRTDPVAAIQQHTGGAHGILVTAVHPGAFAQATGMVRRGGTVVFVGLPPGDFPADIFDTVLRAITIRGSIVGTRQDLIEALDFFARGEIHPTVRTEHLDDINDIFARMEHGTIEGRIVMRHAAG